LHPDGVYYQIPFGQFNPQSAIGLGCRFELL